MNPKDLLERRPLASCVVLVAPAWGGMLILLGPGGLLPAATRPMAHLIASDNRPAVLGFGLTIGRLGGAFEEIGWTGFALFSGS